jgi:hypothetical protein
MYYLAESSTPYALIKVQDITNYGFNVLYASTSDPILSKGWALSTPNISINGSTCYIDYSNVYNTSDRVYLLRSFGSMTAGTTFYINSSQYYDAEKDYRVTVGGTCNFSSSLNNGKIIIATISSGLSGTTSYSYFNKENFIDVPQYTFYHNGSTGYCYLLNTFPTTGTNTFSKMGMLGSGFSAEEYIDISGGTADNSSRIKVYGTSILKDSQEILYFASGGTTQNLIQTKNTINLYIRGDASQANYNFSPQSLGIFTVSDSTTNNIIDCYENQNGNQGTFRTNLLTSAYTGAYYSCNKCLDKIYGLDSSNALGPIFLPFTHSLFLLIETNTTGTLTTYGLYTYRDGGSVNGTVSSNAAKTKVSNFALPANAQNLKIDLSHPSLLGYSLLFFTDEARSIPMSSGLNIYGPLGKNTSFAFIKKPQGIATYYGRLLGDYTIDFTVQFT